jgi:hypothetical protein
MKAPVLDAHDVSMINRLIPEAARLAYLAVPEGFRATAPGKWPDRVKSKWNQVYHLNMDRLAKAEGLRF